MVGNNTIEESEDEADTLQQTRKRLRSSKIDTKRLKDLKILVSDDKESSTI